jgi:hypothetical protein
MSAGCDKYIYFVIRTGPTWRSVRSMNDEAEHRA